MAKDDISLGVEMGRLEIEPATLHKTVKEENPFHLPELQEKKSIFSRTCIKSFKCSCSTQRKTKSVAIWKKKNNKILKEPILKLLQSHTQNCSLRDNCQQSSNECSSSSISSDNISLCTLVDNCNQLKISSGGNEKRCSMELSNESQWWKNDIKSCRQSKDNSPGTSRAGSCSQQALNPPCDVTIDELASYFETLVHIPKKMSSMAEMMYI